MLLRFAIDDFFEDKEVKNLSVKTIERYRFALKTFKDFLETNNVVSISEINPMMIRQFLSYLQKERKNNPTSLNSNLRVIKSFFNHLVNFKIITDDQNPAKKIKYAQEDIRIEAFQEHHIEKILKYFQSNKNLSEFNSLRDYVLVLYLLSTGFRLGEVCNLRWSDIDYDKKVVVSIGKLRIPTSVPLLDEMVEQLKMYQIHCKRHFGKISNFVFVTNRNDRMTENCVKLMFKRMKSKLKFDDVRLSAHTFRHTMAHQLIMNGADVFTLQKMLRHKTLEMSEKYMSMWGTALQEQNIKYNPLNNMKCFSKKKIKRDIEITKSNILNLERYPFDIKEVNKKSGVYLIKNIANNKMYIGKATDIARRWKQHYKELERNKHNNKLLQEDWNQYGDISFVFEVLEYTDDSELSSISVVEKYWVQRLSSKFNLYNLADPMKDDSFKIIMKLENRIKQLEKQLQTT